MGTPHADHNEPGTDEQGATFVPDRSKTSAEELSETRAEERPAGETDTQKSDEVKRSPASKEKKSRKVTQLGEFKLRRKLGQGGMGDVYLANQVSLDREVAIKTLKKEIARKEDFVKRFYREAKSMAKLDHPNVVRCYSVGEESGIHFVAIEYVDGQSMQDWMDRLGKLSVSDAMHVILCCADGLKHAHDAGLIHRDVKPDNILVTKRGQVKVADLGLAKATDDDVSVTQSGTGLGTPLYMAPEQARNAKHVDQRSDIYALGSTLYYFLTGRHPFTGENTLELIVAKEKGDFTPARQINSEVPEKLGLVIDKMMAKSPAHRHAAFDEVIADLEQLQLETGVLSFIDGALPGSRSSRGRGGATTSIPRTQDKTKLQSPTRDKTSADDVVRSADEERGSKNDKWYVQYTDPDGKTVVSQMTTSQIRQALKANVIDARGLAKKAARDKFVPLARYAEFELETQKRATRQRAQARSVNMQDMYETIDREEKGRLRKRFFRKKAEGALGYLSLLLWLALIAGIGYGLYVVVPMGYAWAADHIGLNEP